MQNRAPPVYRTHLFTPAGARQIAFGCHLIWFIALGIFHGEGVGETEKGVPGSSCPRNRMDAYLPSGAVTRDLPY